MFAVSFVAGAVAIPLLWLAIADRSGPASYPRHDFDRHGNARRGALDRRSAAGSPAASRHRWLRRRAHRRYLPALAGLADRLEIVACCDVDGEAAARAAASVRAWSSAVASTSDLDAVLTDQRPDAIFNLTPAPRHAPITPRRWRRMPTSTARSRSPIQSQRPMPSSRSPRAGSCSCSVRRPARSAVASGGCARSSSRGGSVGSPWRWPITRTPAPWRGASPGDPTVFYQPGVGPLVDHGIYRLHELTTLWGR